MGQILLDSFKADHIFLIEEHAEEDEEIYQRLEALVMELDLAYTLLEESTRDYWPELCTAVIKNG